MASHKIHWYPVIYHKSPPVLATLYDLLNLGHLAFKLQLAHKFSIVHCRSYIAAHLGLWMKRLFGVKFVFDPRGFWADERVDGGMWSLTNPFYRLIYSYFKRMERSFFLNADYVVSLTYKGKEVMSSGELNYEVTSPIEVIPCCVDLKLFSGERKYHIKQSFLISYIGSIGTWYLLDEMLDFFAVLKSKVPDARFLFITRESPVTILERVRIKGIDELSILIKSAEREEVPALIGQSDASVFFIKPVFSKQASSPTKQGEIMAMGVPIICNTSVGDTDYVIKKYHSGILIDKFDPVDYMEAIDKLISTKFDSSKIQNGATEFYSLEKGVEKYCKIYFRLCK